MGKADLHIHTNVSDGRFSPEEIVRKAVELGLTIIAIADHDSIDGIEPALQAAQAFPQLKVIPNVEISTENPTGDVHILGYFIDFTNAELKSHLESFRDSRETRAQRMIAKLGDLGMHLNWRRVQEIAGDGAIGRPHVAQAMIEKGYINSMQEAFDKYIAHGGPAYVERDKFTPEEAVALVLQADGLPVMAHPFTANDAEELIIKLKSRGLVGIEAYYKNYTADQVQRLVNLANKYKLITGGGTDYHGLDDSSEVMIGGTELPMAAVEKIIALARQRGLNSARPPVFSE